MEEVTSRVRYWVWSVDKERIGFENVRDAKRYIIDHRPDAAKRSVEIRKGLQLYGDYMIIRGKLVKIG